MLESPILDSGVVFDENYNNLEALNSMCRGRARYEAYPFRVTDTHFHLIPQLLHKIITKAILPRSGSKNHVTHLDMYLMWAMMNGRRVSLPHLLIYYMAATGSTKRPMPYAHLLTQIFEDQGVNLRLGGVALSVTEKFGASNLYQMKYLFFPPQRRWVRPEDVPADIRAQLRQFSSPPRVAPTDIFDERDLFDYSFLDLPDDAAQHAAPPGDQAESSSVRNTAPPPAPAAGPNPPFTTSDVPPYIREMQAYMLQFDRRMQTLEEQQSLLLRLYQQQFPPPNPDA